jgi:hypothetical protein
MRIVFIGLCSLCVSLQALGVDLSSEAYICRRLEAACMKLMCEAVPERRQAMAQSYATLQAMAEVASRRVFFEAADSGPAGVVRREIEIVRNELQGLQRSAILNQSLYPEGSSEQAVFQAMDRLEVRLHNLQTRLSDLEAKSPLHIEASILSNRLSHGLYTLRGLTRPPIQGARLKQVLRAEDLVKAHGGSWIHTSIFQDV